MKTKPKTTKSPEKRSTSSKKKSALITPEDAKGLKAGIRECGAPPIRHAAW